jgi:hypothetical protein
MNWSDYEAEIFEYFHSTFLGAEITKNVSIDGRYSKTPRQVDVLIEDYVAGSRFRTVVDGKFFSSKVDLKDVESFIGMLNDVQAHKGVLITREGFTEAAINRAHYDQIDLDLDILNFKDLQHLQGQAAIPYSGSNAVLVPAPLGWVIDAKRRGGCVATLYERGRTLEDAGKHREWMYINFWQKNSEARTLEELSALQDRGIISQFSDAKITYQPTIKRPDARTLLRKADVPSYPAPEYTGFVEFEDFMFFGVLFTPIELAKRNVRKLEYIMAKILPMKITGNTAASSGSNNVRPFDKAKEKRS